MVEKRTHALTIAAVLLTACGKSTSRWLCLALLGSMLYASVAAAQVVQPLTPSAFSRNTEERPAKERPFWINREDCLVDDYLHFDMKVDSPTDDAFEVWIGTSTDCTTYSERVDDSRRCWRVVQQLAQDDSFTIDVSVRDIVQKRVGTEFRANGTVESCDRLWEGEVSIYFMYVAETGDVISHTKWTSTGVDVKGPPPPSDVEALTADEALQAQWTPSSATDVLGYRVYCAPNGGSAPGGDAGILSDAGVTGGCFADGLVQGQVPGLDLEVCGEVSSKTSQSAFARGLTNGTQYAVAVAAADDLGNAGPLSNVACGMPEPVDAVYENYRGVGGQGGGGTCAVSTIGQTNRPRSGSLVLFLMGALTLAKTRRRR